MFKWVRNVFEKGVVRPLVILDTAQEAVVEQLWPSDSKSGHPWAKLYSENQKRELSASTMETVKRIVESQDSRTACRKWLVEAAMTRAHIEVLTFSTPVDRAEWPWSEYPGISGVLSEHFDTYIQKAEIDLLKQVSDAYLQDESVQCDFADPMAATRETLMVRMNRGCFEFAVANVVRIRLEDVPDLPANDWARPLLGSLWSWYEDSHRRLLGMPPLLDGFESLRYSLFTNIVLGGARDPVATWRSQFTATVGS